LAIRSSIPANKSGRPEGRPEILSSLLLPAGRQLAAGAAGKESGALAEGSASAGAPGCGAGGVPLALWK
jgi:hypothetical protein